ncbi:MAG: SCO family protein [Acidimicrobiia bacterium]
MSSRFGKAIRLLALGLLLASLLVACQAGFASDELQGLVVDPPQPKPSFVLTDTEGTPFDFAAETEGKLALLYFGYTNCPDICPVHMAQIAEVFDQFPDVARNSVVVFVTIDPERDTPEKLRAFLDNFDSRFVGLTGTEEELGAAQDAANVPRAVKAEEGTDYTMNHAAWVIAYAPDGLNYSIYPFGIRQSQWSNDLQILAGMG